MNRTLFTIFLLFLCLYGSHEANLTHSPRMIFPITDTSMKRIHLPKDRTPLQIFLEGETETVIAAGRSHLISFDFQNPKKAPVERKVIWKDCIDSGAPPEDCNFNIAVVHKREKTNLVFICGTNGRETLCCEVNLSEQSPTCVVEGVSSIQNSIASFVIKEGEPSALVESDGGADLYVTYSGSQEYVGIQKFGTNRVGPANHNKEQHYVGLVISRRKENPLQDKVFAFYKEKNRDTGLYSGMWLPFVSQVCMADKGGPKKHMQFSWTSQMNARLFCGDPESRQHFSELVDVATVHAERWRDTKVYGLFRNEWGMSAVCVYTINNFHNIFTNSKFKGVDMDKQNSRPRECVSDSTKIDLDILKMIEENSEMEDWVRPVNNAGPILFNRHRYTHISVDSSLSKRNRHRPVLFLSLHNGDIHKAVQIQNHTFLIAEYQTFNHSTHILNVILNPTSRKLYANSRDELVQVDVANCAAYGSSCKDCELSRDPYCIWKDSHCIPVTKQTLQDVAHERDGICPNSSESYQLPLTNSVKVKDDGSIYLPLHFKYYLDCPVSSLHAEYTWKHPGGLSPCSLKEQKCLHLIDSMSPEQEGHYSCVSEEKGYKKELAKYSLKLRSGAVGHSSGLLLWVCLTAALLVLNK